PFRGRPDVGFASHPVLDAPHGPARRAGKARGVVQPLRIWSQLPGRRKPRVSAVRTRSTRTSLPEDEPAGLARGGPGRRVRPGLDRRPRAGPARGRRRDPRRGGQGLLRLGSEAWPRLWLPAGPERAAEVAEVAGPAPRARLLRRRQVDRRRE